MRRSWSRPERSFWLCRRRAGNFRRRSRLPRSSSLLFRSLCVTLSHKLHRLKALPWFRAACLQRKHFSAPTQLIKMLFSDCNQQAARLLPKRMNNSCSDYTDGATLLWLHQCVPNAVLSVYTGYIIHHICV